MVELLAPAGSLDSLIAAVNAGADAVYIGGSMFGARAYADNPAEDQLIEGIQYCHLHGKKIYMTVNTLLKQEEITEKLYNYLLPYYLAGVDGLIVQDFGVVRFVQEYFPGLEVHSSTQMTITSSYGASFMKNAGITRVVPARELSLDEIKEIIDDTGIEVETFIHGAMCYSYSGQCLFSSFLGGRSGNRGRCAQPCRLPYRFSAQKPAGKKEKPLCLLSMKDMCTIDLIPEILEAGIASLKIEGRMKRPEYTAGVVSIYRKYIDLYYKKGKKEYYVSEADRRVLLDLYNRGGFSDGYYHQHNGPSMMTVSRPNHQGTDAARILKFEKGTYYAEALEPLHQKDVLELLPGTEITLKEEIKKGSTFRITKNKIRLQSGQILYRTKNETLLNELNHRYLLAKFKEKIKGDLRISLNESAILTLSGKGKTVTVTAELAESAKAIATDSETVERQMRKTGSTPFEFESLTVSVEPGLFIPIQKLNEFRRIGMEKLERSITEDQYKNRMSREFHNCQKNKKSNNEDSSYQPQFHIQICTEEQLSTLLNCEKMPVSVIYLDSILFTDKSRNSFQIEQITSLQKKGYQCYFSFPPVLRSKDRSFLAQEPIQKLFQCMDGFLLHTADHLEYIRQYQKRTGKQVCIAADDNFYSCNQYAACFLKENGVDRLTESAELNYHELMQLDNPNAELIIYGHQPLMQSAQCITKNTIGCTGKTKLQYLTDRMSVRFPVMNRCNVCCNTIYNSVPLQLIGCRKEILQLKPQYLRLSFTVESGKQMVDLIRSYTESFMKQVDEPANLTGTRGHFKKGVE